MSVLENRAHWLAPLMAALACLAFAPQAYAATWPPKQGLVVHVFDGDTILVESDGVRRKVRLLGIDTPEVNGPYTKAEPFGKAASGMTTEMALGKTVRLEYGGSSIADKYGRLLAYVTLPDGTDLNLLLIKLGLAEAFHSTQYSRKRLYHQAEAQARQEGAGLWSVKKQRWNNRKSPAR